MTAMRPLPAHVLPLLVGDVGGTNARFALYTEPSAPFAAEETLSASDYPRFGDAVKAYLTATNIKPRAACLAVAAPIIDDLVQLTNRDWLFSRAELQADLELEHLRVLNDFEALALALPHLGRHELEPIASPGLCPRLGAPKLVLGPGTGLGVAFLVPHGDDWLPLPGEGGHACFAPADLLERRLHAHLARGLEHLSYEHLLSGPGLERIYSALLEMGEAAGQPMTAAQIASAALAGDPGPALCLEIFCKVLGSYAGDLALIGSARGGVYLAGGILPRILPFVHSSGLRARFDHKGAMRHFVQEIPIQIITSRLPALIGAAAHMAKLT